MPPADDRSLDAASRGVDPTAQRLLNLLFILNAARSPIPTSRIIRDTDLGYGSDNPASDLRKFRRDRAKLAQWGIVVAEVHPAGMQETEESSWAIDRERTFMAGGLIEEADARMLIRAIDEYLRMHASPLSLPLRAIRDKAIEALGAMHGELPPEASSAPAVQADPVADAIWAAFSMRRRLVFSYTNAHGDSSRRSVAIYGVFTEDGQAYFTGLDDKSGSVRTFRVERVEQVRAPGKPYRIPEDFSLGDHIFFPFDLADEDPVAVSFSFPAARGAHELASITLGRGELERDDTGAWIWSTTARDLDKAAAFALRHARDGMRPHAPAELVEAWDTLIEKAVDAHAR